MRTQERDEEKLQAEDEGMSQDKDKEMSHGEDNIYPIQPNSNGFPGLNKYLMGSNDYLAGRMPIYSTPMLPYNYFYQVVPVSLYTEEKNSQSE